ncbi:hypothetical protein ACFL5X_03950, partial [Candidatus Omnitrophota bacterium]
MYKLKKIALNSVIHALLISVALTCIFPLLWMLASAVKTQQTVFKDMSLLVKDPAWGNFYLA